MGKFEVISGNYVEVANKIPQVGPAFYAREGYSLLAMTEDPSTLSPAEMAEKLCYRSGFIKYQDQIFYFNINEQMRDKCYLTLGTCKDVSNKSQSEYFLDETGLYYYDSIKSELLDISRDKEVLQQLRLHFPTNFENISDEKLKIIRGLTGQTHVINPLRLHLLTSEKKQDDLRNLFRDLPENQPRIFSSDSDILSFNQWHSEFQFISSLLLTDARKHQVDADLSRDRMICSTLTKPEMKLGLKESDAYRSYSQGNFTGLIFSSQYNAFLTGESSEFDYETIRPGGEVGVCYQDNQGVFCGMSLCYSRDDSDMTVPSEKRPKVYSISIIKNVTAEDPREREVTFITYRAPVIDLPQVALEGAVSLSHEEVLKRIKKDIDSDEVYQLFSRPILHQDDEFVESFDILKNKVDVINKMADFHEKISCLLEKTESDSPLQLVYTSAQSLHTQLEPLINNSDAWSASDWKSLFVLLEKCSQALDNPSDEKNIGNIRTAADGVAKKVDRNLKITGWSLVALTAALLVATVVSAVTGGLALPLAVGAVALFCAWLGGVTLMKKGEVTHSAHRYANSFMSTIRNSSPASTEEDVGDGERDHDRPNL